MVLMDNMVLGTVLILWDMAMAILATLLLAMAVDMALYGSYGQYGLGHRAYSLGHGYGHLGYGRGFGLGYGTYGYGKREAEAEPEAEADALYGSYGQYGLGHRAYSLGHGYGHIGYSSLGYGSGYGYGYGKRDAEAEPKSDALYGAYGRYGYGLGHRTY